MAKRLHSTSGPATDTMHITAIRVLRICGLAAFLALSLGCEQAIYTNSGDLGVSDVSVERWIEGDDVVFGDRDGNGEDDPYQDDDADDATEREIQVRVDELVRLAQPLVGSTIRVEYIGNEAVARVTENGLLIWGDIFFSWHDVATDDALSVPSLEKSVKSVIVTTTSREWPYGIVPYTIHSVFTGTPARTNILAAFAMWEAAVPGLEFVPRTTQSSYISFEESESANLCGSNSVGRKGGKQIITIRTGVVPPGSPPGTPPDACGFNPAIAHEIGHAIGFFHAHQRIDAVLNVSAVLGCPSGATSWSQCGSICEYQSAEECGCGDVAVTADPTCDDSVYDMNECGFCGGLDEEGCFALCVSLFNAWMPLSYPEAITVGPWDRVSLMHYEPLQLNKPGQPVFQGLATPSGQSISSGDILAASSMYPSIQGSYERNRDRGGASFSVSWVNLPVDGTDQAADACYDLCLNSSQCQAFTIVDQAAWGYPGWSRCHLKNAITPATTASGMTSMVVRSTHEVGYDRPGSDYSSFSTASANTCRNTCAQQNTCRSYTWVGATSRCWLKNAVPAPTTGSCPTCRSGVLREFVGGLEYGVDRNGSDFLAITMSTADPFRCRTLCAQHSQCDSFTYVDPTLSGGGQPLCYLKNATPTGASLTGTMSGRL